jgi:hypothetical protein
MENTNGYSTGYGYEDDNVEIGGSLQFGLNSGITKMKSFDFNPNAGKDGSAGEALDIIFDVDGKEIRYRIFPIMKAFEKNEEITDRRHPAFVKAVKEFNANITHILSTFVTKDVIKAAFSRPISSFSEFVNICKNLLPNGFENEILDIFGEYQWTITGDNNRTFIKIPKKVKHGKWLCKHIAPEEKWTEVRLGSKLTYLDKNNNKHPFERSSWFMDSNYANLQKEGGLEDAPVDTGAAQWTT